MSRISVASAGLTGVRVVDVAVAKEFALQFLSIPRRIARGSQIENRMICSIARSTTRPQLTAVLTTHEIGVDLRVHRKQLHSDCMCLRHEKPIKRVLMQPGKGVYPDRMFRGHS